MKKQLKVLMTISLVFFMFFSGNAWGMLQDEGFFFQNVNVLHKGQKIILSGRYGGDKSCNRLICKFRVTNDIGEAYSFRVECGKYNGLGTRIFEKSRYYPSLKNTKARIWDVEYVEVLYCQ